MYNDDKKFEYDLEDTKELPTLENFNVEDDNIALNDVNTVEDKNQKIKNIELIIIFILSLIFLLILLFFTITSFLKKDEVKKELNYNEILISYAENITSYISTYKDENDSIPTWSNISENITYSEYDVFCQVHEVYDDGSIYLSSCLIESNPITYSYGKKMEVTKLGKELIFYKDSDNKITIDSTSLNEVGKINCLADNCDFIIGFDNYSIIYENDEYYLYDYLNNKLIFGPFKPYTEDINNSLIYYENNLYAIYFNNLSKRSIYNINDNKIIDNIKYEVINIDSDLYGLIYSNGYFLTKNNDTINFTNLKTGNISFSVKGNISNVIKNNDLVYFKVYNEYDNKYSLYNINGKVLFDGDKFNILNIDNDFIIVSNDNVYKIYDYNFNLKYESIKYDKILDIYDNYVVSINEEYLSIFYIDGSLVYLFDLNWNDNIYKFYNNQSILIDDTIYIYLENNNIPYGTKGSVLRYYYNIITGVNGVDKLKKLP